ncbi:hypothetical protein Hanom_Chr04g00296851 [Helianthus anomalus]
MNFFKINIKERQIKNSIIISIKTTFCSQKLLHYQAKVLNVYMPVNAFFPALADPAGITLSTLNLTVFDNGLKKQKITIIKY